MKEEAYEALKDSTKKAPAFGDGRGWREVSEFWAVRLHANISEGDTICSAKICIIFRIGKL